MTLITWTRDRIREPKAREPVWYLGRRVVNLNPVHHMEQILMKNSGLSNKSIEINLKDAQKYNKNRYTLHS